MKKRFIQWLDTLLIFILHRQLSAHPFWSTSRKHSRPKRWLSIKLYKPLIFKASDFNHYATLRYRWYNRRLFLSNEATTTHYFIPLRSSLVHSVTNSYMQFVPRSAKKRGAWAWSASVVCTTTRYRPAQAGVFRQYRPIDHQLRQKTSAPGWAFCMTHQARIPQRIHLLHSLQIHCSANFVQE